MFRRKDRHASDAQLRRLYLEMRQSRTSVEDLYDQPADWQRSLWTVYAAMHPVAAATTDEAVRE